MSDELSTPVTAPVSAGGPSPFQVVSSRGFTEWMAAQRLSLAVSTYHIGAVIFLGLKPNGDLSMFVSSFDRAMGMWPQETALWLVTKHTVWKLENALAARPQDGYDRVFVPRVGHMTGDADIHDIAVESSGRPVFVNTKFNCLATVDDRFSFAPLWKPPFISALCPEDRCHLNGLALENGAAKYVTLVAKSDVADGWRDFRSNGGLVMDITTNEVIADGLSMPHSPRVHAGKLWLLNAGTGHLGFIHPGTRKFEPVTFLPGYARGLALHGNYAIIGLSKQRRENAFQGLPLDQNLVEKGAAARCGVQVVDITTGAVIHWARMEPPIEELYDIAVLPHVVRPKALGFTSSVVGDQITHRDGDTIQFWSALPARKGS
ncbi:MAG TPA: TIGR03032 family protein [Planctomycetaceae bacterium]|nr:TIGR03032 family protein [Planctomycetaceae bacterium]